MPMPKRQHTLIGAICALCLSAGILLQSGCVIVAAGAAGAGTVAYVRGELESTVPSSLAKSMQATRAAVEQLKLIKISDKEDALAGVFVARTADDKRIEVKLTAVGEGMTKVQIRVGVFGDRTVSTAVFDRIKANL